METPGCLGGWRRRVWNPDLGLVSLWFGIFTNEKFSCGYVNCLVNLKVDAHVVLGQATVQCGRGLRACPLWSFPSVTTRCRRAHGNRPSAVQAERDSARWPQPCRGRCRLRCALQTQECDCIEESSLGTRCVGTRFSRCLAVGGGCCGVWAFGCIAAKAHWLEGLSSPVRGCSPQPPPHPLRARGLSGHHNCKTTMKKRREAWGGQLRACTPSPSLILKRSEAVACGHFAHSAAGASRRRPSAWVWPS